MALERVKFSSEISKSELEGTIAESGAAFLEVRTGKPEFSGVNLISSSRTDKGHKALLAHLSNNGYYLYRWGQSISHFVHHTHVRKVWTGDEVGEIVPDRNGIYFFVEKPELRPIRKLVVALSPISDRPKQSSMDRYFSVNFASLRKYISPSAAILRIGDLGSVVGGFYLNTNYLKSNQDNIQSLIERVRGDMNLNREDVVLYGVSKGATGALYHASQMGYSAVCVDPIVSEAHYWEKYDDSHFTRDTFPRTKDDLFSELNPLVPENISIVTSSRSPQYEYIKALTNRFPGIAVVNSQHPDINDHPAVGGKTIPVTVMLLNMALYGMKPNRGECVVT